MKKSFLTLAAIALVLSFTSCKETPADSTEEVEVIETETQVEETPVQTEETPVEEVDTLGTQEAQVEEPISETPAI